MRLVGSEKAGISYNDVKVQGNRNISIRLYIDPWNDATYNRIIIHMYHDMWRYGTLSNNRKFCFPCIPLLRVMH